MAPGTESPARLADGRRSGLLLPLHGLTNRDQAVCRARDGAAQDEQVALGIDLQHAQVLHSHALVAHAASHAQALVDATGRGARADGAGPPVAVRLAVRLGAAPE